MRTLIAELNLWTTSITPSENCVLALGCTASVRAARVVSQLNGVFPQFLTLEMKRHQALVCARRWRRFKTDESMKTVRRRLAFLSAFRGDWFAPCGWILVAAGEVPLQQTTTRCGANTMMGDAGSKRNYEGNSNHVSCCSPC
jgi:hypothetical protein